MSSSQHRHVVIPFLISLLKNEGKEEPCIRRAIIRNMRRDIMRDRKRRDIMRDRMRDKRYTSNRRGRGHMRDMRDVKDMRYMRGTRDMRDMWDLGDMRYEDMTSPFSREVQRRLLAK